MKKIILISIFITFFFSGCFVSISEYELLEKENVKLKTELDEIKYGAERISLLIDNYYEENNYKLAKNSIELLIEKHPEFQDINKYKKLYVEIDSILVKKDEEKQIMLQEELKNTGIWTVKYYVDEFKQPTKDAYIRNKNLIRGTFSNSATANSRLDVKFLIDGENNISIMLYEYAGSNPVKVYTSTRYDILVLDNNGNKISLVAYNRSDRLTLNVKSSNELHGILLNGGTIKFSIKEDSSVPSEYFFVINNADNYNNAYRLLEEIEK